MKTSKVYLTLAIGVLLLCSAVTASAQSMTAGNADQVVYYDLTVDTVSMMGNKVQLRLTPFTEAVERYISDFRSEHKDYGYFKSFSVDPKRSLITFEVNGDENDTDDITYVLRDYLVIKFREDVPPSPGEQESK